MGFETWTVSLLFEGLAATSFDLDALGVSFFTGTALATGLGATFSLIFITLSGLADSTIDFDLLCFLDTCSLTILIGGVFGLGEALTTAFGGGLAAFGGCGWTPLVFLGSILTGSALAAFGLGAALFIGSFLGAEALTGGVGD